MANIFFTASTAEFQVLTTPGTSAYQADLTYEPTSTFYENNTQQAGDVAGLLRVRYGEWDAVSDRQQSEYTGLSALGSSNYRADLHPEGAFVSAGHVPHLKVA